MWGSPAELEAVALVFFHLFHRIEKPTWYFTESKLKWGASVAKDETEHHVMRERLYGTDESLALGQVMSGFAPIFASMKFDTFKSPLVLPVLEEAFEQPQLHGRAEQVHAVIFALMGFASSDAHAFVEELRIQRTEIGGHELRPFFVVAPKGPSSEALGYQRKFTTFGAVQNKIKEVIVRANERNPGDGANGQR
jgi:hypothetical protein